MTRPISLARTTLATLVALLALTSCGTTASYPDRAPNARGTLAPYVYDMTATYPPNTVIFHLTIEDDEYSYYTDAVLFIDNDTILGDQVNGVYGMSDLAAGLFVEVWTDVCRESYPVQCDVSHLRLTRVD